MMFALRAADARLAPRTPDDVAYLQRRVEAAPEHADAPPGSFVAPMCGHAVTCVFLHNIWQWVHHCTKRGRQ